MILRVMFVIFISVLAIPSAAATAPDYNRVCERTCGRGEGARILPYPFGFSEGCRIHLKCSMYGEILIGEFHVQNLTADSLSIRIPANCSRSIEILRPLFGSNYAPTLKNGFLLHGCSAQLTDCMLPLPLILDQFETSDCYSVARNLSCFSSREYAEEMELMTYQNVTETKCKHLFSSFSAASKRPRVSLEFQTLQLGWWINGECRCSQNATCDIVNASKFRCRCGDGFSGDGYIDGLGCRRVSPCVATGTHTTSTGCRKSSKVGIITGAGVIAGGFLAVLMAGICTYTFIQRRSAATLLTTNNLLSASASSVPVLPYKLIHRATGGFSDSHMLGTGAYGTVYAGKLHAAGEWVAVKKFKHTENTHHVMNEIRIISTVRHPNLVRLLGCCIEEGEQILVYEFMPNGTLSEHLRREKGTAALPWAYRLSIAAETADAIAHLHSAVIYHRDIKSSNILLDNNLRSKVADFGLSRLGVVETSHVSTAPQGTPGYVDPEYNQQFHLSDKSDVYSFGVVLVETITGMKAVDFSRSPTEVNLAAMAVERIGRGEVEEMVDPNLELNRDAWTLSSVHGVAEMAFRCLAAHGDMRPSMKEVAAELERIRAAAGSGCCCCSSGVSSSSSSSLCGGREGKRAGKWRGGGGEFLWPAPVEDEVEEGSPVSVYDHWVSDRSSSPSAAGGPVSPHC